MINLIVGEDMVTVSSMERTSLNRTEDTMTWTDQHSSAFLSVVKNVSNLTIVVK